MMTNEVNISLGTGGAREGEKEGFEGALPKEGQKMGDKRPSKIRQFCSTGYNRVQVEQFGAEGQHY